MRDKISLGDLCKYYQMGLKMDFGGVPEELCFYRKMGYSKNQEFRCIYLLYYSNKGGSVETHPYWHRPRSLMVLAKKINTAPQQLKLRSNGTRYLLKTVKSWKT